MDKEELKYPIKYAILGIEEQVGWYPGLHELEREYDVCGYIVSKVYLVGEYIKYNSDGTNKRSYQVVFPYYSINERRRQVPKYNLDWQCYNCINVKELFDNYGEAKKIADEKNDKLRDKCYSYISFSNPNWKEIVAKSQTEFDERMKRYIEFEQFILRETDDMEITIDDKESIKSRVKKK